MTDTLERPVGPPNPAPSPTPRGPGARALTWVGGIVGGVLLLSGAYSAVDLLAMGSEGATTVAESATYDGAPVVELVADGHVTVTTGGDRVEVDRTSRTVLSTATYRVDESSDRLRVSYRCEWWRPGFCSASLDVTVPDGTSVIVRALDGTVTATSLRGPLDVHVSDGSVDVSEIDGDVTVRSADARTSVRDVRGTVDVSSADGPIEISDVSGDVTAQSSDGRTEIWDARANIDVRSSDGGVTVHGTGRPVALDITTADGRQTVEGAVDPTSPIHVRIDTVDGYVEYLGPRG
ncbi:DUF4097 family beta strand repeat-containing protein [Cellulomonas xylanilytica]|uniref:DUF4097 domain-containing protein n=1 Tax=Cellulomonas xylanilytica TaxID=233583 RepID=A0A510V0I4_9CELL|nr:DUF4097 family beta strand repeat-containing protein [Cellulomonas xylanilytica]GEK20424.1 hypothetical protein CXY01_09440 [Cellulomonas xylanilytica]